MRHRAATVGLVLVLPGAAGSADADEPRPVFRFTDPAIGESSGLVVRDGLFVTVNDSGDTGRVFTVDPATGDTVGVTSWVDPPVDAEALAPVPGTAGTDGVWVADVGDNQAARNSVEVLRVPVGRGDRAVTPTPYALRYPDGPRDAETLLVHPRTGRLAVVTKGLFGGRVMLAPRRLSAGRPNRLRDVGAVLGVATDGAFFADGRHVIVRDYTRAVVYRWPSLRAIGTVTLPRQQQGEGLAVDERDRVFVSSEGAGTPVLRVPLPRALVRAVRPPEPDPVSPPAPDAATADVGGGEPAPSEPDSWPWLLGGVGGLSALAAGGLAFRSRRRRTGHAVG